MALLAYDETWLREPRLLVPKRPPLGECKINPESELFKRLRPNWVFGPQRKAYWPETNPVLFSALAGGKLGGSPSGKAMCANGGTSDGFVSDKNADFLSGATSLSGFVLLHCTTTTGVVLARWGATPNFGGFLVLWESNQLTLLVAPGANSTFWVARRTASAGVGLQALGFVWDGTPNPDTMSMYLNGKPDDGTYWFPGSGNTNAIQTASWPMYVCRHGDAASGSGNTKVMFAALAANRMWSAADHAAIAADPFEMVMPA